MPNAPQSPRSTPTVVPYALVVADADALSACESAASDTGLSVSSRYNQTMVLEPKVVRKVNKRGWAAWSVVADERIKLQVQLVPPGGESDRPAVSVAASDAGSRETFCKALRERLAAAERRATTPVEPAASKDVMSLEDFLLKAEGPSPSPSDKKEVAELLRRRSLLDWYGVSQDSGDEAEAADLVAKEGVWKIDDQESPERSRATAQSLVMTPDSVQSSAESPGPADRPPGSAPKDSHGGDCNDQQRSSVADWYNDEQLGDTAKRPSLDWYLDGGQGVPSPANSFTREHVLTDFSDSAASRTRILSDDSLPEETPAEAAAAR